MLVDVEADPVREGIGDDTEAHVGRGVVQVTKQVHSLCTPLGPQLEVQLLGTTHFIWAGICHRGAGRKGTDVEEGRGKERKSSVGMFCESLWCAF